ncbi:MAG: hypothetical protein IEMM0006_1085 [bacterium]|nr:MAG: hypothetical protein IEMM0006_1085 [bacterium]
MAIGTKDIFRQIYLWTLILIAVALPLSKYFMSAGSFFLLALWLWSDFQMSVAVRFFKQKGILRGFFILVKYLWTLAKESSVEKTKIFLHNKAAIVFASVFLLSIAGLLFTANFDHATNVLRIKLPLVLFPLVFSSSEKIDARSFRKLMLFYIAALLAGTLIGSYKLVTGNYLNVREFSPFISPVRFGLNIGFGILSLGFFVLKDSSFSRKQKLFLSVLIVWFVWFLIKMESVTSLSLLLIIALGILIYMGFQTKKLWLRTAIVLVIILIPAGLYFYVKKEIVRMTHVPAVALKNPVRHTLLGNTYVFDSIHYGIEDGRYVGAYLSIPELRQAWNKRSSIKFSGTDKKGNPIKYTLIRYMTSKDLHKDAAGVSRLTGKDIENIEQGIANFQYVAYPGLHSRLLMMVKGWQVYRKTGNAGGSSTLQRYEFLRAAVMLIRRNFWTGVGTGDLIETLGEQYRLLHSGIGKYYGFIAHNEYADTFVAFGVFGFLYFLFALVYPPLKTHSFNDYFFMIFYAIMLLSMFSDDTLETHAGVTLFAFFLSLLMFGKKKDTHGKLLSHNFKK